MSVDNTLAERGARYGRFADHAKIAQGLQDVMRSADSWNTLDQDMKQALSVIADKIARILNGDPFYGDNWHDIQGYAKLVEDRINAKPEQRQELYTEPQKPLVSFEPWIREGLTYEGWLEKERQLQHGLATGGMVRHFPTRTAAATVTPGQTIVNVSADKPFNLSDTLNKIRDAANGLNLVK